MTATLASVLAGTASPGVFVWRGGVVDRDVLGEVRDSGWNALHLDTSQATDAAGFYSAIAEDWDLPDWFGRNLDALWDVLAERTLTPTVFVWDGSEAFAAHDPDLAVVLLGLLRDAATQAEAFAVVLRPDGEVTPGSLLSELDGLL